MTEESEKTPHSPREEILLPQSKEKPVTQEKSAPCSSGESAMPNEERRKFCRKAILMKRMLLSEMTGECDSPEKQFYLNINDISEDGMKITTDVFIPEDNLCSKFL